MSAHFAYVMGRSDYSDGKAMSDNRFLSGSQKYKDWERGWIDAVRADPLLDANERVALIGDDT